MKRDLLYDNILDAIRGKIPNRGILTNTLADLLNLEKEAVYRRLRGEVAFSFSEIAVIASTLGISLDNQVGARYVHSRPFQLRLIEYVDSGEIDYEMLEHYIYIHNQGKEDKKSKVIRIRTLTGNFVLKTFIRLKVWKRYRRGALRPQNLSARRFIYGIR